MCIGINLSVQIQSLLWLWDKLWDLVELYNKDEAKHLTWLQVAVECHQPGSPRLAAPHLNIHD